MVHQFWNQCEHSEYDQAVECHDALECILAALATFHVQNSLMNSPLKFNEHLKRLYRLITQQHLHLMVSLVQ